MEDIQYSQVNILVRIREGELLTNEEFQKYIQFNSLDELRESLRTTHYGKYAAKDDFFDSIDKYLMKDRAETFRELYSVSPDKEILYFFTRRFTFHNIKIAIKSKFTGRDFSHLAIPDGVYPYAEITQAVLGNYSAALPSVYEEAIQLANDYLDKEGKHYGVDIILDRIYYELQLASAKKIGNPLLIDEVKRMIDLTNLSIVERAIIGNSNSNDVRSVLFSGGEISMTDLQEYSQKHLSDLKHFIGLTNLKAYLSTEEKVLWAQPINVLKDDLMSNFLQGGNFIAFGPTPLLHFLNKKEMEQKNLRLIITGLRSFLPKEEIKKRLRRLS